jgi:hypothetical protein
LPPPLSTSIPMLSLRAARIAWKSGMLFSTVISPHNQSCVTAAPGWRGSIGRAGTVQPCKIGFTGTSPTRRAPKAPREEIKIITIGEIDDVV